MPSYRVLQHSQRKRKKGVSPKAFPGIGEGRLVLERVQFPASAGIVGHRPIS